MKKILIIDDSHFMRLAIKNLFPKDTYEFTEGLGGENGLELFASEKPDLVLLDVVMPGMRGVEVLKRLKEEDPNVKVIMITAVGRELIVEECKQLGVVDYIKKPFDENRVRKIVEKCLE